MKAPMNLRRVATRTAEFVLSNARSAKLPWGAAPVGGVCPDRVGAGAGLESTSSTIQV
jgi:hypothetical protein